MDVDGRLQIVDHFVYILVVFRDYDLENDLTV